jgi:hypothetical protein
VSSKAQGASLETYAKAITAIEASILLGLRQRTSNELLVLQELFEDIAQRNLDICDVIVEARLRAPSQSEGDRAPDDAGSDVFRT